MLVLLASSGLAASGCAASTAAVPVEDGRLVMGTVLDVSLRAEPGREAEARRALDDVFDEVQALGRIASRHDEESALSRLNARAGKGAARVDRDLYEMLRSAEAARGATRGAFDVGVGPLVSLWTRAAQRGREPAPDEIADARSRVGRPLELTAPDRVHLAAGTAIDLGGFAKGFALDRAMETLRARGFHQALLDFGGSSQWAAGGPWRLQVGDDRGTALAVVELRDRALSMSSSLSQSSVIEGVRYGHVVDPRSGQALRERRSAVVVARDATTAEVLSTALLVLDEPEARAVLAEQGAEAWVRREDGADWQSEGWQSATGFRRLAPARGEAG